MPVWGQFIITTHFLKMALYLRVRSCPGDDNDSDDRRELFEKIEITNPLERVCEVTTVSQKGGTCGEC